MCFLKTPPITVIVYEYLNKFKKKKHNTLEKIKGGKNNINNNNIR